MKNIRQVLVAVKLPYNEMTDEQIKMMKEDIKSYVLKSYNLTPALSLTYEEIPI